MAALRAAPDIVPSRPGVYAVIWPDRDPPSFLVQSPAGWFKGRDPTVPIADLDQRWLPVETVYLGRSGNLRTRWRTRLRFASGAPVGAFGGRRLWQIGDSERLLVAWCVCDDPLDEERRLLDEFREQHGGPPFANR